MALIVPLGRGWMERKLAMAKKALTFDEKVDGLQRQSGLPLHQCEQILTNLENNEDWSIYHKKQNRNGRRPNSSRPMTPALKREIRSLHRLQPNMTQSEIAAKANVNIGRVSEALDNAETVSDI